MPTSRCQGLGVFALFRVEASDTIPVRPSKHQGALLMRSSLQPHEHSEHTPFVANLWPGHPHIAVSERIYLITIGHAVHVP